jgi:hypothetical protein
LEPHGTPRFLPDFVVAARKHTFAIPVAFPASLREERSMLLAFSLSCPAHPVAFEHGDYHVEFISEVISNSKRVSALWGLWCLSVERGLGPICFPGNSLSP